MTFLLATVLHVIYLVFIPTPKEWPGTFPYDIPDIWWTPFVRHWSLFPQHFPVIRFIDIINGAFLTMFIYKIGRDIKEGRAQGGDGNGNEKVEITIEVPNSKYVEWAMGALFSGIIFASARLAHADIHRAAVYVAAIFIFSFVLYYFLYKLRQKLRMEEKGPKAKSDGEDYAPS